MKIGYEAKKAVKNFTGIGNYSRRVINAVAEHYPENEIYLFHSAKTNPEAMQQLRDMHHVCPSGLMGSKLMAEIWRCFCSHNAIKKQGIDVYHGLSNELPFDIRKAGCKTVVTIHDLIFLRYPKTYKLSERIILRIKTRFACRVADKIIAVSQKTKDDIMEFYHVPEDRIKVIYQRCHDIFFKKQSEEELDAVRRKYNLPEKYLINVGTIQYRKNQRLAIKAMEGVSDDVHLVIVGKRTGYQNTLEDLATARGVSKRVHFLNGISNHDLAAVYQMAQMLVYPSMYEGFGIPLVEAMASGIPVIAADSSCLEEVAGPDNLYCPPFKAKVWAETINSLLADKSRMADIVAKNSEYVKRFQWKNIAEELHRVYEEVVES